MVEIFKSWDFISIHEVKVIASTVGYDCKGSEILALVTDIVVHRFNHVVLKSYNGKLSFKPGMLRFQKVVIEGNFSTDELNLLKKKFIVALRREFMGYALEE